MRNSRSSTERSTFPPTRRWSGKSFRNSSWRRRTRSRRDFPDISTARENLPAAGVPQGAMGKPFIGVATSFTDLVPGHVGMRALERVVENGVHAAGGYPFLFGVPAVCDGIAMGHRGMHYSLPLRELIADMIESVAEAHALDGLVLLTNCDKITPGMLMAAARLN